MDKKNFKICLIGYNIASQNKDYILSSRNLGIALLASTLRGEGYEVDLINPLMTNMTVDEIVEKVQGKNYKMIAFSVLSGMGWRFTETLIKTLRKKGEDGKFIVGGIFATFSPRLVSNRFKNGEIECVCTGEGEETLKELAQKFMLGEKIDEIKNLYIRRGSEVIYTGIRDNIKNLDEIPFSAEDEAEECYVQNLPYNMQTSRGCYGVCSYCSCIEQFYGHKGWRYRSSKNVVDEIEKVHRKYGIKKFSFVDENFIGPGELGKKRAIDICDDIIKRKLEIEYYFECRPDGINEEISRKLSESGCKVVFLGIESGSDSVLKELNRSNCDKVVNKKSVDLLSENGIEVAPGYIMITPDMEIEDLKVALKFLNYIISNRQHNNVITMQLSYLIFSELIISENTRVFESLKKQNRLNKDYSYKCGSEKVQKLREMVKAMEVREFLQSTEDDIRKTWIEEEIIGNEKYSIHISNIKSYEKEMVSHTTGYLLDLIDNMDNAPKSKVESDLQLFKEKMLAWKTDKLHGIEKIKKYV